MTSDETLPDRLEAEIKAYYLAQMSGRRGAPDPSADLRSVITDYLNWAGRRIPVQPRGVHLSTELMTSAKAVEHRALLDALVAKIANGDDLNPHRSRRADAISGRDRMLADAGVQHLHFKPEGGMDDLVFAVLDPGEAYLIGIYPHRAWALEEVPQVIVRNWPQAGIYVPTSAIGLTKQFSDEDRNDLRAAGISVGAVEIDGRVWMPRVIGQTLDGGSMMAAREAMKFIHGLNLFRWGLDERLATIAADADRAVGRSLSGEWEPTVYDGWYGLQRGGVFVRMGELV